MALIKSTHRIGEQPSSELLRADHPALSDLAVLLRQLEDPSAECRRWAARDLVRFKESSVNLVERLLIESEVSVREVILTTLVHFGDHTTVVGLVQCLRSEDVSLRNEAIEALKKLPDAVAPIMRGLLTDDESDVRIFAVNVLESLRHPEVETWLTEVIENDPHVNVCGAAVDLLGEVGSRNALESLVRLKATFGDEPYIQFAADLAIKRILED
jgi:HEAT repeat protein